MTKAKTAKTAKKAVKRRPTAKEISEAFSKFQDELLAIGASAAQDYVKARERLLDLSDPAVKSTRRQRVQAADDFVYTRLNSAFAMLLAENIPALSGALVKAVVAAGSGGAAETDGELLNRMLYTGEFTRGDVVALLDAKRVAVRMAQLTSILLCSPGGGGGVLASLLAERPSPDGTPLIPPTQPGGSA
jgi:hypothetical protein